MQNNTLKTAKRKKKKRIGRGGKRGTYSGRGMKGQKSRTGAHVDPLFEGGRSSLSERMKKLRGFKSLKAKAFPIQLSQLEKKLNSGVTVTRELLASEKMISKSQLFSSVKILGSAKLTKQFIIGKDIQCSQSAKQSIEAAGGRQE